MAGVCVQTQGVATVYSARQSELARTPKSQPAGMWRRGPMLPLQCLMDSKAGAVSTPLSSPSEESAPQEPTPKRRGKKKLLKKRKTLSSLSCASLNSNLGGGSGKGRNQDRGSSSLPDLNASTSRIDELSMPSLRASGVIPSLVTQPHERRKKLPLLAAIKPHFLLMKPSKMACPILDSVSLIRSF